MRFPLEWVLSHGSPSVQYRAIRDVARLDVGESHARVLPFSDAAALRLALESGSDGVWNDAMLVVPSGDSDDGSEVGTVPAVHRLLECGFPADVPALMAARRPLFRLLAEDNQSAFLFELRPQAKGPELRRLGRLRLREAAAAALAHLGYEQDPRLRGCADRMVNRVREFLESPLAADPWVRSGRRLVLSPDADPPSIELLVMLSHLPRYQHEHYGFLEQLLDYLSQPAGDREVLQPAGDDLVPQPRLLLGDPLAGRSGRTGDIATTLFWIEHFARLQMLDRHPGWSGILDRLLEGRDGDGVWRAPKGALPVRSPLPAAWSWYPLDPRREADAVSAEVTTRLGIIARAAGREVELV